MADRQVAPRDNLVAGKAYPMTMVVIGTETIGMQNLTETSQVGQTTTTFTFPFPEYSSFVYVQTFDVVYPGAGPNSAWVQSFIGIVNSQRGSNHLVEDQGLDTFAASRFQTASSNYAISDYGFDTQAAAYFNGSGRVYTEEILYPETFSPDGFSSYVQQYAPGHWTLLVDPLYSRFGYYIGTSPTIEFSTSCAVTEISQRNVNITQIAIENGCQYKVVEDTWLLLVLSS